jgi:hypothetical protein
MSFTQFSVTHELQHTLKSAGSKDNRLYFLGYMVGLSMHVCLLSPASAQIAVRADQTVLQQPVEVFAGITLHRTFT